MLRRRKLEDELRRIYFAIPTILFAFIYWEIGRRQRITEAREGEERKLVHGELSQLRDEVSAARERAAGAIEAEKARKEKLESTWQPREHLIAIAVAVATIVAAVATVIAYNVFG